MTELVGHTIPGTRCRIGHHDRTVKSTADKTVSAKRRSFEDLLTWARGPAVWAFEDCRHVSGALERFLLARGERTVPVAPMLMAGARRSRPRARQARRGRPCPDRRAQRYATGLETLPTAPLARPNSTCGCSSTTASGRSRSAPV